MKFRPHGTAHCKIDGQFVFIELRGPWNVELMQQIQIEISTLKKKFSKNSKWGLLVLVSNSLLCTFDTIDAIKEIVAEDSQTGGHAAIAFVVHHTVEGRGLVDNIFRNIYADVCPMSFFDTLDDAKEWIREYMK